MKLRPALRAMGRRWRHPGMWLGAVALPLVQGLPLAITPLAAPWAELPIRPALLVVTFHWALSILVVGFPFQWTGDDRPQAGFWRGLAQWTLLELLLVLPLLPLLPWHLDAHRSGVLFGILVGAGLTNGILLLVLNWILVRAETEGAEVSEAERRAKAAERLVARQTLSPRTIHHALDALQSEPEARRLEQGLVDLAVLFRNRLMLQAQPVVSFAQEQELLELLLKVLARTGRFPAVTQHWPAELATRPVPSLALVQVVEILADLLETCPVAALSLSGARFKGMLELRVSWHGGMGCDLLARLERHPEFMALERRLSGAALLREPLSTEGDGTRACVRLRIPEVAP